MSVLQDHRTFWSDQSFAEVVYVQIEYYEWNIWNKADLKISPELAGYFLGAIHLKAVCCGSR